MQFFKSLVAAILAFSAYATAAALPEPKAQCGNIGNSCTSDDPCCGGFTCDFSTGNGLCMPTPAAPPAGAGPTAPPL
ncbi:hypothetical protein PILCRDRAFT_812286, partial [Piloderma croceum F 1598]